jgi:hypothetical protein
MTATYAQADAEAYCANLSYGGFTDWRLPSPIEYSTLIDRTLPSNGSPMIQSLFMAATVADRYRTSALEAADNTRSWFADFVAGNINSNTTTQLYRARCVR